MKQIQSLWFNRKLYHVLSLVNKSETQVFEWRK